MAKISKTIGNIPYSVIKENREKTTKREGINKIDFDRLEKRIKICGFENEEGVASVYFFIEDEEEFDSIINNSDKDLYYKKVDLLSKQVDEVEKLLIQLDNFVRNVHEEKSLENGFIFINEKIESMEDNFSEALGLIGEIINNKNSEEKVAKGQKQFSDIKVNECENRLSELVEKFDLLYVDIIKNIAYLRSDLKIQIGKKSISKVKKIFLIISGILLHFIIIILFVKYTLG